LTVDKKWAPGQPERRDAKSNVLREMRAKTPAAGLAKAQVLAGAALICGFVGIVATQWGAADRLFTWR
jgi:hypothetical protein